MFPCVSKYHQVSLVSSTSNYLQWFAKSLQLCLCDPVDCSPQGSSVHGILHARILEWVAISSSRGSSWPRNQTCVSCIFCIDRQILFTTEPPGKPQKGSSNQPLGHLLVSLIGAQRPQRRTVMTSQQYLEAPEHQSAGHPSFPAASH